ncbi:ABC transporter ATP-binding protein [Occallatibacter riparius]|uniref:ATP-binding cassette domain-containing protein n=1 Tax=Occallatibacter riparius TaxID=1002689 RepID=A0A9J7BK08_9BACT|nr:ATP-binding cassette domain-containing protein [Occallatibacter riparius]UWZ82999.1 ATP-binding cassette domain-containing protein [Occallatibacter riparius]
MLEFALDARRGAFHLEISCRLTAEWTVIFGHSGAGKSTLLRLLAGLDRPDNGRIAFGGTILTDIAARLFMAPGRRGCAFVTQQPALFPHMNVRSNVVYGVRPRNNLREWMGRVDEALALVGASDLHDRYPRDLSGGEAQRVAVARAIAVRPKLLLLDEPFSALDGPAADALLDRLQVWLRNNGVQTVMATHEAADAFALGAEVALLQDGRLAALGPPQEVLAQERERITSRLSNRAVRLK